jgi:hypothetical protein
MKQLNQYTSSIRIANFSDLSISYNNQLTFNSVEPESIVKEIRKYTDLPFIFVVTPDKIEKATKVIKALRDMRSPCFPYAIITLDGLDLGEAYNDIDVFRLKTLNDDTIINQIEAYKEKRLNYEESQLNISSTSDMPETTDVFIVGAGVTGLYAAERLQKSNISFCVVDKRDKVGGIWSMFANETSRVNSSEASYRLTEPKYRSNRDHSATRELLEDISYVSSKIADHIYLKVDVQKIEKSDFGYKITYQQDGAVKCVKSKGVILAINDRVGPPRKIEYPNQTVFKGEIVSGFADKAKGVSWQDKNVVIVGMGAFAIENARTALESGAKHVTVLGRRHGTICPKIIDYLNFATPYDEAFKHDKKSNIRNMMYWKKLYDLSGATQPECWMGKVKHTGHTISVSDIWFIAHYLKKIQTVTGDVTEVFDKGVIINGDQRLNTDIIVNCVGFEKNSSTAKEICGYPEMFNNNYVDKDFMYLADAYIDDDAFNSFFGSSVLEMVKFYLEVYVYYFGNSSFEEMSQFQGIEKIPIDDRGWSHYIKAANSLIENSPHFLSVAKKQVTTRTSNFLEKHDLETYIAENKREWIDIHCFLAGREMPEDQCLPYVFEKLLKA